MNMQFDDVWEVSRTCEYVLANGYTSVTLQFPDDMLKDAPLVAGTLQHHLTQKGSAAKVYVLADTSYNPLSVDEVAAAHVQADCVIHYGYASLHPVSRIPALCVLPKAQLDVQQCSQWAAEQLRDLADNMCSSRGHEGLQQQRAVICCDQSYMHLLPELKEAMLLAYSGPLQLVFADPAPLVLRPATGSSSSNQQLPVQLSSQATQQQQQQQQQPPDHHSCEQPSTCSTEFCCATSTCSCSTHQQPAADPEVTSSSASPSLHNSYCSSSSSSSSNTLPAVGGLVWQLPHSSSSSSSSIVLPVMVWLGPSDSPALLHLQLTHSTHPWLLLHPVSHQVHQGLAPGLDRLLKRRYYLVERARSASMVGLLVGTLGAAGYLQALRRIRELAKQAGKKTYTLLMGKPNPAKLANFPEIEVFVMLADPQGLILDTKEYLNPIITPHEAYLAFTDRQFEPSHYRLDFGDLLVQDQLQQESTNTNSNADTSCGAPAQRVAGNVVERSSEGSSGDEEECALESLGNTFGGLVLASSTGAAAVGAGSRTGQQVQVHSAAQYLLQQRSFKGLETPATGGDLMAAELAVPGRSGRAAVYVDEPVA